MKQIKQTGRLMVVAAGLCLLVMQSVGPAHAQKKDDVIRVNTELVVVDAQVLNKKTGNIVGTLRRDDFQVYEDGVKQEIEYFSQDKLPLSIVMLFDRSER